MKRCLIAAALLTLAVWFISGCTSQADDSDQNTIVNQAILRKPHDQRQTVPEFDRGSHIAQREEAVEQSADSAVENREESDQDLGHSESAELERKIIRERYYRQEVQDLSQVLNELERMVNGLSGAFIESIERWESEERNRTEQHARVVLRIPVDQWPELEKDITEQGNILNETISGEDVTEEYVDNDARLRNLKAHEERLLELYEQAENIEDMLKIEAELSRIRSSIEQLESKQKYLDQVTSTIRVTLDLMQVEAHEFASGQNEQSLWKEGWLGFKNSLQFMLYLGERGIVMLITALPYLAVPAISVIIIFFRKRKRGRTESGDGE